MNDEHGLISALKQLAQELGTTPTKLQFIEHAGKGSHRFEAYWRSWNEFINAAGLAPNRVNRITNKVFEKSIDQHLEEYKPRSIVDRKPWPKIAVLGDLHEPFGHDKVKSEFKLFCEKHRPDYIVQVGDPVDFFSHSKFPKSHNIFTPQQEEDRARKNLEELWSSLNKSCPKAKKIMLLGNHSVRPLKRVLESVPSIEHWAEKYLKEYLSFDGVETVMDPREEYKIQDIIFIHGFRSGAGTHRDFLMGNTVLGHLHTGNVSYRNYNGQTFFELNAGLAGDPFSKGLSYTPTKTTGWTIGYAYIDQYGPRFIPL